MYPPLNLVLVGLVLVVLLVLAALANSQLHLF